jgi:predicted alpha-1,6-mannanase (GH76 family)
MFARLGALLGAFLLALPAAAQAAPAAPAPAVKWITEASATLDGWYDQSDGQYRTTNWWNTANALRAQLVASALLGNNLGPERAANTYNQNIGTWFRNDYYDDEGWWGLTWVQAYDQTGESKYLVLAESLFSDMAGGWDLRCGGGIWWSKSRDYKNAIPNELFLSLAAALSLRTDGPAAANYKQWALLEWDWFAHTGMINAQGLVNDGLTEDCANNGRTTWTYNQGVVLGGLADLYRLTGNRDLLAAAGSLATAAMTRLSDANGVLHEPCEAKHCDVDQTQFKGIFVRNLVALNEVQPSTVYTAFAVRNALAVWRTRSRGNQLGLFWSGPFDTADASRQSSALDCLNAALQLS